MMVNRTFSYRPWFLLTNIASITITTCEIIFALVFISIVLRNRTFRSISNLLAVNTVFALAFFGLSILVITINMWQCDNHPDRCTGNGACVFRNYLNNIATTNAIYSLVVQSIHRFLAVLYANKVRIQKYQLRVILCVSQWFIAIIYPLFHNYIFSQLHYDAVSHVCVIADNSSTLITIYVTTIDALIPFAIIVGVYVRLYIYVRRLRRTSAIPMTTKREVRMAQRIFFLLAILAVGSMPGIVLQSMQPPPEYQLRIYYLGVTITSMLGLICLFNFTPQVKQRFVERFNKITVHRHPQVNPNTGHTRDRY